VNNPNGLLFDPLLKILASQVDDLESLRVASGNRFRQLTSTEVDDDGIRRSLGLPEDHRDVKRIALSLEALAAVEDQAIKQLQSHMRRSQWGPWIKQATGVGEKQLARLLGEIGDPYWNTLHQRPRTVSELWAYCGYHTLPSGHSCDETQGARTTGTQLPASHYVLETQMVNAGGSHSTAPKRTRGQKSNWSQEARKRAWLIATSCVKAPSGSKYRTVYDETRAKYADAVHNVPCKQCGPSGKPAEVGSPLPPAHQHGRALRAIAKTVLKDLWIEARRLHGVTDVHVPAPGPDRASAA
jgi:hypothetical protein